MEVPGIKWQNTIKINAETNINNDDFGKWKFVTSISIVRLSLMRESNRDKTFNKLIDTCIT